MCESYQDIQHRSSVLISLISVLLIAFGIVGLVYMILHEVISAKFFLVFSPVFIILFGGVMLAVEFRIGFVMEAFDFLGTLTGKGIFYIQYN